MGIKGHLRLKNSEIGPEGEGKMAAGQPTKYREEYSTDEYIEGYIEHCKGNKKLVSLVGLACYINVAEETLKNWGKAHKEFLVSLDRVLRESKEMLCNGGLDSTYNSTIAKLILAANHGMSDKVDINASGSISVVIDN